MITATRTSFFFSAWILAVTTTLIETEAFTTSTRPSLAAVTVTTTRDLFYTATARIPTSLSGKKKKKSGGGGGSATSTKIQVKLLHHIAGTGQAGDVILVNPIFFDNKLRPQKLARVITDEEVQAAVEKKQDQSDELMKQARAVKDLLDEETTADDAADASPYVLEFRDNQTGPDGKKLFGGIGPKKLMESLRNDCKEFDAYSKQFTKQVSIIDIEEQETVVEDDESSDGEQETKYKDYSSSSSYSGDNSSEEQSIVKYSSLPKKDKLTIKHTGVFRLKVALNKDLFAKVKVVVD